MNLVKDIGDYLATNAFGTVGTDIFLATLPSSPDECIAVYLLEDTSVDRIAGIDAPIDRTAGIKRPRFKIVTRAADYATGIGLIHAVEEELVQIGDEYIGTLNEGVEINGSFYFRIDTSEDAFEQETDGQGLVVFAQHFNATIKI